MQYKVHKKSCDIISCTSTEGDSAQQERDQSIKIMKTNPLKHKTQLCKNYSENGYCPYGQKCRFAHGFKQIISKPTKTLFRKKKCNGFWQNGFCSYGIRCQFAHAEVQWQTKASLLGIQSTNSDMHEYYSSKLLRLLQQQK